MPAIAAPGARDSSPAVSPAPATAATRPTQPPCPAPRAFISSTRAMIYARPVLLYLYRAVLKPLLRRLTGTSELLRVCKAFAKARADAAEAAGWGKRASFAELVVEVERVLLHSKQLLLERRALESKDCDLHVITRMVLLLKLFPGNGSTAPPESRVLADALASIHATHCAAAAVNSRVATRFDSVDKAHEKQLLELWSGMMPNEPLEGRLTKQWTKIGFQGKDPATDFRGMGMQGLDDLTYMVQHHGALARRMLAASHHPVSWYSLAIAGINITAYTVQLLRLRRLQWLMHAHMPERAGAEAGAETAAETSALDEDMASEQERNARLAMLSDTARRTRSEFYCYVMYRFDAHWRAHETKLSVMDFERELAKVKRVIEADLDARAIELGKPGWSEQ